MYEKDDLKIKVDQLTQEQQKELSEEILSELRSYVAEHNQGNYFLTDNEVTELATRFRIALAGAGAHKLTLHMEYSGDRKFDKPRDLNMVIGLLQSSLGYLMKKFGDSENPINISGFIPSFGSDANSEITLNFH